MSRSYAPPYHGAYWGMNDHCIQLQRRCACTLASVRFFSGPKKGCTKRNWLPLSDMIIWGTCLKEQNLSSASKNCSPDRSNTISRCTALVTKQVNITPCTATRAEGAIIDFGSDPSGTIYCHRTKSINAHVKKWSDFTYPDRRERRHRREAVATTFPTFAFPAISPDQPSDSMSAFGYPVFISKEG